MLMWPSSLRIFLAREPVDLRRSIDGLSVLVTEVLREDPYSGCVFVFRGRRSDRLKLLVWARNGFLLVYKRLEKGRFQFPEVAADTNRVELEATQLALLLDGLDTAIGAQAPRWQPAPAPVSQPSPTTHRS